MLGIESGQTSLAEAYLWSGKNEPLVEPGSFYDRFAKIRPELLREEDFESSGCATTCAGSGR